MPFVPKAYSDKVPSNSVEFLCSIGIKRLVNPKTYGDSDQPGELLSFLSSLHVAAAPCSPCSKQTLVIDNSTHLFYSSRAIALEDF